MHVELHIKIFHHHVSAHGTHNKVLSSETCCRSQYLFFPQSDSPGCTSI